MNAKEKELLAQTSAESKRKHMCTEFDKDNKSVITVYTPTEKQDKDPYEKHEFNFDYVFECSTDQEAVYTVAAKPIVQGCGRLLTRI